MGRIVCRMKRLRRAAVRRRAPLARALRPLRRVLAAAAATRSGGAAREIQLGWDDSPQHALTVRWVGDSRRNPALARIRRCGGGEGGDWSEWPAATQRRPGSHGWLHVAELRGLEPDCRYELCVSCDPGCETAFSEPFALRTAPASRDARVTAVFLCDVGLAGRPDGTSEAVPEIARAIASADPLCVLGGGDYVYADRDGRYFDPADAIGAWIEQMQPLLRGRAFLVQLGNHEVELVERIDDWRPRLSCGRRSPSGLSGSFDFGPMHCVGLHAPGRAPSSADLAWLEADLQGEAARSAAWRVVFQHAPIFAHGRSHPARPELRALMPIFDRLGVDLHLSGHDQSFERTHPLRADGSVAAPLARADGEMRYAAGAGVVYAKVSPAGKHSDRGRGFSVLPLEAGPEIAARSDQGHHWARLEADARELCLRVDALSGPGAEVDCVDTLRLVRAT